MMTIKIPAFLFLVEIEHLILKFVWKAKGPRTIRITLKKKNKAGGLTSWFQHYKAIVIKRILLLFSRPVMSNSVWPHGLQHARPSCPSTSAEACQSSCPLYWWCHPAISSSNALFFCPQSFWASRTFPVSRWFTSDDQNTGHTTSIKTDKQRYWTE